MRRAFVLLGNSSCGKDTIASRMLEMSDHLKVYKFSQPIKDLTAEAVGVHPSFCEDKAKRSLPIVFWQGKPKSILDILQDSYHEQKGTILHSMMVEQVVTTAVDRYLESTPIFTDIRNIDEAVAVKRHFPDARAFLISRPGYDTDVMGDEMLANLSEMFAAISMRNEAPCDIYEIAHSILSQYNR